MDQVQQIVQQISEVAKAAARTVITTRTGTVLGRNPDGSVIIDDGSGGCTVLAALGNVPQQCGAQVVLSLDTEITTQNTVCPVAFTIIPSGKPTPTDERPGALTEPPVDEGIDLGDGADGGGDGGEVAAGDGGAGGTVFIDNAGNIYDGVTGWLTGATTTWQPHVSGWGYSGGTDGYAGPDPDADQLQIGHREAAPNNFGFGGAPSLSQSTAIRLGAFTVRRAGFERENTDDGEQSKTWYLNIRDADFDLVTSTNPTYLHTWFDNRPLSYPSPGGWAGPVWEWTYTMVAFADPEDGTFWVSPGAGDGAPAIPAPMFNISASGTLIRTIYLIDPATGASPIANGLFNRIILP